MIANCGALHLNWERLSMSGYFEALEAHNIANEPKSKSSDEPAVSDIGRLRRFHRARKVKVANDG